MGDLPAHQLQLYSEPIAAEPWYDLSANRPGDQLRAWDSKASPARKQTLAYQSSSGVSPQRRARQIGIAGEELIGGRLDRLGGDGWRVLHSVPVSSQCDIDHVLIGPGGVFTINTKHRPNSAVVLREGTIFVRNRDDEYVAKSLHESARASSCLSRVCRMPVGVRPVLVFHAHSSLTVTRPLDDVLVLASFAVPRAFRKMRAVLDQATVARVYEYARRSTTWR